MADHKDDFFGGDFDLNKDGVTDFFEREFAWEILEKPMRDALAAQQKAEVARATLERATQEADIIVKADIERKRVEVEAEAQAEQMRRIARGEADSILLKRQAEANGMKEILTKQAEGFREIIEAAGGNANDAIRMMIADKMEDIVRIQVEAIRDLKIDKITVWDSNGGQSPDGKTTTANFLSGLMKSIPPMNELFDLAGMQLPEYLGKPKEELPDAKPAAPDETTTA